MRADGRHQNEKIEWFPLEDRFQHERATNFWREYGRRVLPILLQQRGIVDHPGCVNNSIYSPEARANLIGDSLHSLGIANVPGCDNYFTACVLKSAKFSNFPRYGIAIA